jgi:hypothetical protein
MRTMHTDGSSIESGVLSPFFGNRNGLLRSLLVPVVVVCLAVLALAAVRWFLTGFGHSVESLARASSQSREARSAMRARPPEAARTVSAGRARHPPSR